MPKFCANLSLLFTEYPLERRFQAAAEAGFTAVEIQFPYALDAESIKTLLQKNRLRLILFNVDADDLLQGGEGLAAVPEKRAAFQQALDQALDYAHILHPEAINVLPGRCMNAARSGEYLQTLQQNLQLAADSLAKIQVKTVFEAINSFDMPGFLIHDEQQMLALLENVNHPNLSLQYDIYHRQRMGENWMAFIQKNLDKIGHLQFADCPGRGEPGSGEIDMARLFSLLDNLGYNGWCGAEYKPTTNTAESLAWLRV